MGFFKLYKPKTYNYRYIYYDPKKEAQKEREERYATKDENGEQRPTIRRGTFREELDRRNKVYRDNVRQSNIRLIIILGLLLLIAYYLVKLI